MEVGEPTCTRLERRGKDGLICHLNKCHLGESRRLERRGKDGTGLHISENVGARSRSSHGRSSKRVFSLLKVSTSGAGSVQDA